MVEVSGIEPLTCTLRTHRAPGEPSFSRLIAGRVWKYIHLVTGFLREIQCREIGDGVSVSGEVGVLVDPGCGVGAAVAEDFGGGLEVSASG